MKKGFVGGAIIFVALAGVSYAALRAEEGEGDRLLPTHEKPRKVAQGVVQLAHGKIKPFVWSVYAQSGHDGALCFAVRVVGPIGQVEGQSVGGPEASEVRCGMKGRSRSRVLTVPTKSGERWSAFDIGIAAYDRRVTTARLMLAGGKSHTIPTRRLRRDFGIHGLSAIRYAVFASEGCVFEVLGFERRQIVSRDKGTGCG